VADQVAHGSHDEAAQHRPEGQHHKNASYSRRGPEHAVMPVAKGEVAQGRDRGSHDDDVVDAGQRVRGYQALRGQLSQYLGTDDPLDGDARADSGQARQGPSADPVDRSRAEPSPGHEAKDRGHGGGRQPHALRPGREDPLAKDVYPGVDNECQRQADSHALCDPEEGVLLVQHAPGHHGQHCKQYLLDHRPFTLLLTDQNDTTRIMATI